MLGMYPNIIAGSHGFNQNDLNKDRLEKKARREKG